MSGKRNKMISPSMSSSSFPSSSTRKRKLKTLQTVNHPHQCLFCESLFPNYGDLETHTNSHTEENPYSCSTCACSFNSTASLHRHQQTGHLRISTPGRNVCGQQRNSTTTVMNSNLTDIVRRIILDKTDVVQKEEEEQGERGIDNNHGLIPPSTDEHIVDDDNNMTEKEETDNEEDYHNINNEDRTSNVIINSELGGNENEEDNTNGVSPEKLQRRIDENVLPPSPSSFPAPKRRMNKSRKRRKKIKTGEKVKKAWTCDICGSVFHRHDSYSLDRHKRTVHRDIFLPEDMSASLSPPPEKKSRVSNNGYITSSNGLEKDNHPSERGSSALKVLKNNKGRITKGKGTWRKKKRIWKCEICGKEFYRQDSYSLKRHQRTVHRNLFILSSSPSSSLTINTSSREIPNHQKTEYACKKLEADVLPNSSHTVDASKRLPRNGNETANGTQTCSGICDICGKLLSRKDQYSMSRHKRNVHRDIIEELERQETPLIYPSEQEKEDEQPSPPGESTPVRSKWKVDGRDSDDANANSYGIRKLAKKKVKGRSKASKGGGGRALIKVRTKWSRASSVTGKIRYWKCTICSQFFHSRDRYSLNRHLRNVHRVNPSDLSPAEPLQISPKKNTLRVWKCEICGKVFHCKSRFNLTRHLKNVHSSHGSDSEGNHSIIEEDEDEVEQHASSSSPLSPSIDKTDEEDEEQEECSSETEEDASSFLKSPTSLQPPLTDFHFLQQPIKFLHPLIEQKDAETGRGNGSNGCKTSKTWDPSFFLHLNRYKPEDSCFSEAKAAAATVCSVEQEVPASSTKVQLPDVMKLKCEKCGKTLSSRWSLKRHKRIPDCLALKKAQILADGSKPKNGLWFYRCSICDKGFGHTRSNLARHIASMHRFGESQQQVSSGTNKCAGGRRSYADYSCLFCDLKSKNRVIIQHHIISTHLDRLTVFQRENNPSGREDGYDTKSQEIKRDAQVLPESMSPPPSPPVILESSDEEEEEEEEEYEEGNNFTHSPVAVINLESDEEGDKTQVDISSLSPPHQNNKGELVIDEKRDFSPDVQEDGTINNDESSQIPLPFVSAIQSGQEENRQEEKKASTCTRHQQAIATLHKKISIHVPSEDGDQGETVVAQQLSEEIKPNASCSVVQGYQVGEQLVELVAVSGKPLGNLEFRNDEVEKKCKEGINLVDSPDSAPYFSESVVGQSEKELGDERTELESDVGPDHHGKDNQREKDTEQEQERNLTSPLAQLQYPIDADAIQSQNFCSDLEKEEDGELFGGRCIEQPRMISSLLLAVHEVEKVVQQVPSSTNLGSGEKDEEHYKLKSLENVIDVSYCSYSSSAVEKDVELQVRDGIIDGGIGSLARPLDLGCTGECEQSNLEAVGSEEKRDIPTVPGLYVGDTESESSERPEHAEFEFIPDSPHFTDFESVESDNELDGSNDAQITFLPPTGVHFQEHVHEFGNDEIPFQPPEAAVLLTPQSQSSLEIQRLPQSCPEAARVTARLSPSAALGFQESSPTPPSDAQVIECKGETGGENNEHCPEFLTTSPTRSPPHSEGNAGNPADGALALELECGSVTVSGGNKRDRDHTLLLPQFQVSSLSLPSELSWQEACSNHPDPVQQVAEKDGELGTVGKHENYSPSLLVFQTTSSICSPASVIKTIEIGSILPDSVLAMEYDPQEEKDADVNNDEDLEIQVYETASTPLPEIRLHDSSTISDVAERDKKTCVERSEKDESESVFLPRPEVSSTASPSFKIKTPGPSLTSFHLPPVVECNEQEEKQSIKQVEELSAEEGDELSTEQVEEQSTKQADSQNAEQVEEQSSEQVYELTIEQVDELPIEQADELPIEQADELSIEQIDELSIEQVDELTIEQVVEQSTEQMEEQSTEQMEEQSTEQMEEQSTEQVEEQKTEQVDEPKTEQVDEPKTEQVDEQNTEQVDEQSAEQVEEESTEQVEEENAEKVDEENSVQVEEESTVEAEEESAEKVDEENSVQVEEESTVEAEKESTVEAEEESIEKVEEESAEQMKGESAEQMKGESAEQVVEESTNQVEEEKAEKVDEENSVQVEEESTVEAEEESAEKVEEESTEPVEKHSPQRLPHFYQIQLAEEREGELLEISFSSSPCTKLDVVSAEMVSTTEAEPAGDSPHHATDLDTSDSTVGNIGHSYNTRSLPASSFKFKCEKCERQFAYQSDFKRHRNRNCLSQKTKVVTSRWYPCTLCKRDFKDKRIDLIRHLVGIHCYLPQANDSEKKRETLGRFSKFCCVFCGSKSQEREAMKQHILTEHGQELNKSTERNEHRNGVTAALIAEIKKKDSPSRLPADDDTANSCEERNWMTIPTTPLLVSPPENKTSKELTVTGKKMKSWLCDICGKTFYRADNYSLNRHRRTVHKDILSKHGKNLAKFTEEGNQQQIIRMEAVERKVEGRGEVEQGSIQKEKREFSPIANDDVVKGTTEKKAYTAGENNVSRSARSALASYTSLLRTRKRRKTKKLTLKKETMKIWMCDICGKVFYRPNSSSLNRHKRTVHKDTLVQEINVEQEQLEVDDAPPLLFKETGWEGEDVDEERVMPTLTPVVILSTGDGEKEDEQIELKEVAAFPQTEQWQQSNNVDGWVCRKCGKRFQKRSGLFRHQAQPTDCLVLKEMRQYSIWYWCFFCHRDFGKRRHDLIRHITRYHCSTITATTTSGEKPGEGVGNLSCGFCTEPSESIKVLHNHIKRKHLDRIQVKQRRIPSTNGLNTKKLR